MWDGSAAPSAVVCVHGLGASHRYWLKLAQRLAAQRRVFAPDLPGFGFSGDTRRARDVHELAVALAQWIRGNELRDLTLVGNSMGAQIVVDLAIHSPELVKFAVLISPTYDPWAGGTWAHVLRFFRNVPYEAPSLPFVLSRDYLECGPRRYVETYRLSRSDPLSEKLRLMHTPTLVIRGDRDPIVTSRWGRQVAEQLPNGSYAEVPGRGHAAHYSAPDDVTRLISAFVTDRT